MRNLRVSDRHDVSVPGRYRAGRGFARDVTVVDLSAEGCRFFDKFGKLHNGDRVSLRIGLIGPIDAVVAWSTGEDVGVRFASQLYGPVFEHIREKLSYT